MRIPIAIIDLSNSTLSIYDVPKNFDGDKIEEWIIKNTNHRLSEISWGAFDGEINDRRDEYILSARTLKDFSELGVDSLEQLGCNYHPPEDEYGNKFIGYRHYDEFELAQLLKPNLYHLIIGRSYYTDTKEELEILLWDWVKWQVNLCKEDMLTDLHIRAKELLDEINEDCSLDEVDVKKHSDVNKARINYLKYQFECNLRT